MDVILQTLQHYEANYPEMLYRAYVVNGNLARMQTFNQIE